MATPTCRGSSNGRVALQVFSAVTKVPAGQNYQGNRADSDMIIALAILQRWPLRTWQSLAARASYQAGRLHDAAARSNGRLSIVTTRAELDRFVEGQSRDRDRVAGVLAIEGLHALDGEARNIDTLFRAGFRMMGLAHFFDNEVSGSAHGQAKGGLTPLGRDHIRHLEALGVIVDLSVVSALRLGFQLDTRLCQVGGFAAAVTFNYAANRRFSFAHAREIPLLYSYVWIRLC